MTNNKFPQINRKSALKHLALLGYKENETVFFRFFYPSDDPRKDGDKGRKLQFPLKDINWEELEAYQGEGRGIYIVVNGQGDKNDEITFGRAHFIEHDNLDKAIQRDLWQTLNLPEPTFQLDTGGKSIHSYWTYNQTVPIEQWCPLQKDLLNNSDADRSIKNSSRVMRLAGGWHISHDSQGNPVYNQTHFISTSGKTVSYEDLRQAVPEPMPDIEPDSYTGRLVVLAKEYNIPMEWDGKHLSSATVSELDRKVKILDVVQKFVALRKSGKGYVGKCPFHDDQGESLNVSPEKNLYHCYGCNTGGGAVHFLGELEKITLEKRVNKRRSQQKTKPVISPGERLPRHPDEIQVPVSEPIPLHKCCCIETRKLIDHGVPKGSGRNNIAMDKVLPDLVGVERHLTSIGQSFYPTGQELFHQYCQRSGMTAKEEAERWEWAKKKNYSPSCPPETITSIIQKWYWNEFVKPLKQYNSNSPPRKQAPPTQKNSSDKQRMSKPAVCHSLNSILSRNLSQYQVTEALNELSLESRWTIREIRTLMDDLEVDFEQTESRRERFEELQQLETYKKRSLTLANYLPSSFAEPITRIAKWMEAPTAAYLVSLLAATASNCHTHTRAIVKESIGFIEPAIVYAGIVTESGQRKSPILNSIIKAIKDLQAEEDERHATDKAEYDKEYSKWENKKDSMPLEEWKDCEPSAPIPLRELFIDKVTLETIDKIKGDQPDVAFLWLKDELSGLFGSFGAYKHGRGDDKESVLSSWNGQGVKKNLKSGERVFSRYDAMSILGAIQDSTLQKLMGNFDDDQGEWGRFLWALIPLKALRLPKEDSSFELAFLKPFYEKLRKLPPQHYRFTPNAQGFYDDYHWILEKRRVAHPKKGMRAAISKMEGYTARLAMILHIIWELEAGKTTPSIQIPKSRVIAACKLSEFFLSQVTLIHSQGSAAQGEGGLTPVLSAILTKLRQFGELTARKIQASISYLRKEKPTKIRQYLVELSKLGYGVTEGEGNRLKLVLTADTADKTVDKTVVTDDEPEFIDIRSVEDTPILGADTADGGYMSRVLQEEGGDFSNPLDELSKNTKSPLDENYLPSDQQINSSPSNDEITLKEAVDELSTEISTVDNDPDSEDDSDPDDDPNPPGGGSKIPSPPDDSPDDSGFSAQVPSNEYNDSPTQSHESSTTVNKVDSTANESNSAIGVEDTSFAMSTEPDPGDYETLPNPWEGEESPVALRWLLQILADLEFDPKPHPRFKSCNQLETLLFEVDQTALFCYETLNKKYPDYFYRLTKAIAELTEILPAEEEVPSQATGVQERFPQGDKERSPETTATQSANTPSLAELRALLLACKTLNELLAAKKKYPSIKEAYLSLSEEERLQVDAVAATQVTCPVYKYTGDTIKRGGKKLNHNALVYIDPNAIVRKSASYVPVWLINGLKCGWDEAISVSRKCLTLIEKAIAETDTGSEVIQFELFSFDGGIT